MKREKKDYRIRASLFWMLVGGIVLLVFGVYFKEELHETWLKSGGMEDVTYEGIQSGLKDQEACYLCGKSERSMIAYYQKFDTIGLISLNDWYVLDFHLMGCERDGKKMAENSSNNSTFGNTGEITYSSDSSFNGTMASVRVYLPEKYELKTKVIQKHLCQKCLDKVLESLEFRKWKHEKKEAVPLCLVDFKTLEIYSLQDWHRGCLIRNYWVEIEPDGNEIKVDVYAIPAQGQ